MIKTLNNYIKEGYESTGIPSPSGFNIPNTRNSPKGLSVKTNDKPMAYELYGRRIIVYPYRLEENIKDEIECNIMYTSYSNSKFSIFFTNFSDFSFDTNRKLKKYLLDNLPVVKKVISDESGISVDLERGVFDALEIKEY